MNQDADDLAVADHLVEVIFDGLLAQVIGPLLAGLGESLLLARIPARIQSMVVAIRKETKMEADLVDITVDAHWRLLFPAMFTQHLRRCSSHDTIEKLSSLKAQES